MITTVFQRYAVLVLAGAALLLTTAATFVRAAPETAQTVLARSIRVHGGARLTAWKTMVVEGIIDQQDGIVVHAAYRLWAKAPGKLRVEHDLTADRGRRFDQYFLNGGVAWLRRNLVVSAVPVARMQRWLDQCSGVAAYEKVAALFSLQLDATVQWQEGEVGSTSLKVVETRPAWVMKATVEGTPVELYIDKERNLLLQEVTPDMRRVYSGFASVAGRTVPMKINEFAKSRQGEVFTPIRLKSVKYDVPVENWLFEEDKPAK
jgi:hypothetical protein